MVSKKVAKGGKNACPPQTRSLAVNHRERRKRTLPLAMKTPLCR